MCRTSLLSAVEPQVQWLQRLPGRSNLLFLGFDNAGPVRPLRPKLGAEYRVCAGGSTWGRVADEEVEPDNVAGGDDPRD